MKEIDIVKLILQREEFVRQLKKQNDIVLKENEVVTQAKKELEGVAQMEEDALAPEIDKNLQDHLRLLLSILASTRELTIELVHALAEWQEVAGAPFLWFVLVCVNKGSAPFYGLC